VEVYCDVAIDALGKIFVTWSEYQFQSHELRPPRARAFDPDGNAIIFGFWPTLTKTTAIAATTLATGRFVNFWLEGGGVVAHVLEIPPPSGVVCGDGILTPGFEECDNGAANSDTAPNACRTNCLLPRCGDDVTDTTESCDDGNTASCDGCSATCVAEPGYVCGDGIPEPSCGEQCDDGNAVSGDGCTNGCALEPCVTCTGAPSVCAATPPAADCAAPLQSKASKIQLKDHPAGSAKDKLSWKYGKGAATTMAALGDPVTATDYELCVYDGPGPGASLLVSAAIPGGGDCAGKPCWKMIGAAPGKGFKYKSKDLTPDGIGGVVLKAGPEGRTKIIVKGKGTRLGIPAMPVAANATVTVQLSNDAGSCWNDTYSAPAQKNDGVQFKDKGD
jgi:cysteine-rich repeat protein